MNWEAIGAVSEGLAAIGVVISLLYLATQIRLSRAESRSASIDRLVELWSQFAGAQAEHPSLAVVVAKSASGYRHLELVERIQLSAHMSRIMRVSEAIYMHHLDDSIDRQLWAAIDASLRDIANYVGVFDEWWPTRRHWFSEPFAEYVDSLRQSGSHVDIYAVPEPPPSKPAKNVP